MNKILSNFHAASHALSSTCPCSSVDNALGHHVQWSMMHLRCRVQSLVRVCLLFTKELFQIILMHLMNREIIPGRKGRVRRCPLQSVTVADTLISSVKGC